MATGHLPASSTAFTMESWKSHWESLNKTMGKCHRTMDKPWEDVGKYGKTMGKPWENHGKTLGKRRKIWENHGKTWKNMEKPWKNHGSLLMKINNEPRSLLATWLTGNSYQSSRIFQAIYRPNRVRELTAQGKFDQIVALHGFPAAY